MNAVQCSEGSHFINNPAPFVTDITSSRPMAFDFDVYPDPDDPELMSCCFVNELLARL